MKKLFILLLIILIVLLVQKFKLPSNFKNNYKGSTENQATNIQISKPFTENNYPIIGVHYRMIDSSIADQNSLIEGAYITKIIPGSPAEKADLREEDIITKVDGIEINGGDEQFLSQLIAKKKSGAEVVLEIWRYREIKNISVTLEYNQ